MKEIKLSIKSLVYTLYIQEVLMKTFLNFINRRKKFSTFVLLNV